MGVKLHELIYAPREVEAVIKAKYPDAKITDASDDIHTERFELDIKGISEDDFYPFAIREGFARCCLGFEFLLLSLTLPEPKNHPGKHKEVEAKIETWIEISKNQPVPHQG